MPHRMRNPFEAPAPAAFFWTHGGWSHYPPTQTPAEGRKECAEKSAAAEAQASARGWSFDWEVDTDSDSREFAKGPAYALWGCTCRDETGDVVASLWAIDFGRDGEPWGDPYRRIVQADLAAQGLAELPPQQ